MEAAISSHLPLLYLPLTQVVFLPQDAILPKFWLILILTGLPSGCSFPCTASTWLCTKRLTLQVLPHVSPPRAAAPPAPCPPPTSTRTAPHKLKLWPGVPVKIICELCLLQDSLTLHHGLLLGCMCRSASRGVHGLQRDSLPHHGPLHDL